MRKIVLVAAVLTLAFFWVLVHLPHPPAPKIKNFSSDYALRLYPDGSLKAVQSSVVVNRTNKGDRLDTRPVYWTDPNYWWRRDIAKG